MAVQWRVIKLPISSTEDFSTIESELADLEEAGWDLGYMTETNGFLVMLFKKKTE